MGLPKQAEDGIPPSLPPSTVSPPLLASFEMLYGLLALAPPRGRPESRDCFLGRRRRRAPAPRPHFSESRMNERTRGEGGRKRTRPIHESFFLLAPFLLLLARRRLRLRGPFLSFLSSFSSSSSSSHLLQFPFPFLPLFLPKAPAPLFYVRSVLACSGGGIDGGVGRGEKRKPIFQQEAVSSSSPFVLL